MDMEHRRFDDGQITSVPHFMKEIIAEVTALARHSPDINQRSGVSVRISTANYESIISNAQRRAIRNREQVAVPRISDLPYIASSTMGKVEMEMVEEDRGEQVLEKLVKRAVANVFARYFSVEDLQGLVQRFQEGLTVDTSEIMSSDSYIKALDSLDGLANALESLGCEEGPAAKASATEFILEGLHLNKKLNKSKEEKRRYRYQV